MRVRALASLLLVSLSLTGFAQLDYHPLEVGTPTGKTGPKPVKLPVWAAKPAAAARLAPEQKLFGWAIRPPRGFVYTQKADGLNQIYIFQGSPRANKSAPLLWVVTGDAKHVKTTRTQAEEVMDEYMIQLHQNRDDWKVTPIETGLVQGRKFLRRHWSGTEVSDGVTRRLHGIVYLTLTGTKFAAVTVADAEPDAKTSLNLMETSALTFHKK